MNKKIYMIIVIISTLISLFFILSSMQEKKEENEKVQVENKVPSNQARQIDKGESKQEKVNETKTSSKDSGTIDKNKTSQKDYSENNQLQKITVNDNADAQIKEDTLTAAMIFKVDKSTIAQDMPIANKAKLLFYATELSPSDYARIKNILSGNDYAEGAKEIFRILKNKLNDSDYKEVKSILNPYINTDKIEQYLNT